MESKTIRRMNRGSSGFSMIELVIAITLMVAVLAIAVPSFKSSQRVSRANGMIRELATELRLVRQDAMAQLRAVTLQYDDQNKQIVVIRHTTSGVAVLTNGGYPNNGTIVRTISLNSDGLTGSDIIYGRPSGVSSAALTDNSNLTALTNGRVNITFQPDGSVINAAGNPVDNALFIYNTRASMDTAAAISVLGAAGRVKVWRYSSSANKYLE